MKTKIKNKVNSLGLLSHRFLRLEDGWIRDKLLGIDWGPSSKEKMTWRKAKGYCLKFGCSLPTIYELISLIDYNKHDLAIDKRFFGDTETIEYYWTRNIFSGYLSHVWCVGFNYGFLNACDKKHFNYVRPVRSISNRRE